MAKRCTSIWQSASNRSNRRPMLAGGERPTGRRSARRPRPRGSERTTGTPQADPASKISFRRHTGLLAERFREQINERGHRRSREAGVLMTIRARDATSAASEQTRVGTPRTSAREAMTLRRQKQCAETHAWPAGHGLSSCARLGPATTTRGPLAAASTSASRVGVSAVGERVLASTTRS